MSTEKLTAVSDDELAAFYRRYPYPRVDQVEYDLNLLDHYTYVAHACFEHPAPRRGKTIGRALVAGAGTREAVMWGLSLPHFSIDAVDLSETSVEISRRLAAQLGVENIRHRVGDLEAGQGLDGPYDFISSFGVLHHLPHPERGLEQLVRHLAPRGVMALMLYSHTNRRMLQEAQRAIALLASAVSEPEERESVALALCRVGADSPHRLRRVFERSLVDYDAHRQHFADTMLNPREVSYSVPELRALLRSVGLELVTPAQPVAWDLAGLLPPDLLSRFRALSLHERMEMADLMKAPLLSVLARRPSERRRPCDDDEALFWKIVPMPLCTGRHRVEALRVNPTPEPLVIDVRAVDGDKVLIGRTAQYQRPFHPIAQTLIELVDGRRTLGEIGRLASARHGTHFHLVADALRRMLGTLFHDMAIATPDITACHTCPYRAPSQGDSGAQGPAQK